MPTREHAIKTATSIFPTAETIIPVLVNRNQELNDDSITNETPKEQQDKRSKAEKASELLRTKKYTKKDLQRLEARAKKNEKEAQYELGQHLYLAAQKSDPEFLKISKTEDPLKFSTMVQESAKFLEPALEWLQVAAKQNVADAQYILAVYNETDPRPKGKEEKRLDALQALRWHTRAANAGHDLSQCTVGLFYQIGTNDTAPRNSKTAYNCFLASAMQGNCGAQYYLGLCYLFGQGVQSNKKKANYWLTRSKGPEKTKIILDCFAEIIDEEITKSFTAGTLAKLSPAAESRDDLAFEQKDKRSKSRRYKDYLYGEIEKRFSPDKIALLNNLVELGYTYPAFKLGAYYYFKFQQSFEMNNKPNSDSKIVAENEESLTFLEKSIPLLKLAATDNIAAAQVFLSKLYLNLSKTSSDSAKKILHLQTAYFWIKKAADLGDAYPQYKMAEAYLNGLAVADIAKNIPAAKELYRAAAMQGHHKAQLKLANLYLEASKAPDLTNPDSTQIKKKGLFWLKTAVGAAAAAKRLEELAAAQPAAPGPAATANTEQRQGLMGIS